MLFKIQNSGMWTQAGVDFALLYLDTWYMLWTVFLQNILTQKKISIQTLPHWTHSTQTLKMHCLLEGTINTHKPFLLQPPETPEAIFKRFCNSNLHWPLWNIFVEKDKKHVNSCHFLIIKSVETAISVGTSSQTCSSLQDSGQFTHFLQFNLS